MAANSSAGAKPGIFSLQPESGSQPDASDSEWREISEGVLQRDLRGVEIVLNHSEHHNRGNFELSMQVHWEMNITDAQIEARFATAWYFTRLLEPALGIEVETPDGRLDKATFRALRTLDDAERWVAATCRVIKDGRSVFDVQNGSVARHLPSAGRMPMMYLILSPRRGSAGVVFNTSHVLSGHHGLQVLCVFVAQMVEDATERGLRANFKPDDLSKILPLLPRSTVKGYEQKFNPSPEDLESGMEDNATKLARFERSTVGIPVHPNWSNRISRARNISFQLSYEESEIAKRAMKDLDVNMTTAFFAALTSAIAQTYGRGDEEGAHLLFSAHSMRWLDTSGKKEGRPPITMGIIPGGAYVDNESADIRANDRDSLVQLAKAIAWEMIQDVDNPHIIGALDQLISLQTQDGGTFPLPEPTISRPVLSSQGPLPAPHILHGSGKSSTTMVVHDGGYAGRNTEPTVCFATSSFRGEFRWNLVFDEKFFDAGELSELSQRTGRLFRKLYEDALPNPGPLGGNHPAISTHL